MENAVMRRFFVIALGLSLVAAVPWALRADEYKLMDDSVLRGTPVSFNEDGLVVRLETGGGFSERVPWIRFTQAALKKLAEDPKAKPFVEPFILESLAEKARKAAKRKEIPIRPVPHVDRPTGTASFLAEATTPTGLLLAVLLVAANIYAGLEISVYRRQPAALVCALSALFPVLGPVLFLSLPTRAVAAEEEAVLPAEEARAAMAGGKGSITSAVAKKATAMAGRPAGLTLAAAGKTAAAASAETRVFRRGDYTFNRRFFETQFAGFFRIVPSEAEKNLALVFRTGRGEYVGRRISRIGAAELHLQLLNSSNEIMITFAEMSEVIVRPKDAKA
jgi:hypothetical protein